MGGRAGEARARTALEVVVVGRNVFAQVSGSLAPLRDLVAAAIARRSDLRAVAVGVSS